MAPQNKNKSHAKYKKVLEKYPPDKLWWSDETKEELMQILSALKTLDFTDGGRTYFWFCNRIKKEGDDVWGQLIASHYDDIPKMERPYYYLLDVVKTD